MRLRNFTPHDVTVFMPDGTQRVFPSEGEIRVRETGYIRAPLDGIPTRFMSRCDVEGFPADDTPDTYYIVSGIVREHVALHRSLYPAWFRFVSPNTSPGYVVRDERGRIAGVTGLVTSL